jgi:hypothetical protein
MRNWAGGLVEGMVLNVAGSGESDKPADGASRLSAHGSRKFGVLSVISRYPRTAHENSQHDLLLSVIRLAV